MVICSKCGIDIRRGDMYVAKGSPYCDKCADEYRR